MAGTKKSVYIFDIDGTLADLTHRLHYIEGKNKDWDSFYANCSDDSIIPSNVMTFLLLRKTLSNDNFLFVTGRPESTREDTEMWLGRNCFLGEYLPSDTLYMRKDGDNRPDTEIKKEIYEKFIKPNCNVVAVFEDRDSVVKMWRDLGVTCYQVTEGHY